MKKLLALLLTLALCLSAVSAFAEGATVNIAYGYDPNTLDYAKSNLDVANFILAHTAEALLKQDASGAYVPGIAETYEKSDDGRVWTFTLRDGLTYQDGETPITTEDLYYAVKRLLDPNDPQDNATFGLVNAESYYNGECAFEEVGVKVIDEKTIEYTFVNPTYESNFTSSSLFAPLEEAFVEAAGATFGTSAETYLADGPYMVAEWVPDSSVTLVPNPAYYDPDFAKVGEINVTLNAGGDVQVDMMLAGELNIGGFSNPLYLQTLQDAGFVVGDSHSSTYQGLNLRGGGRNEETGRFLSNAHFRRALSFAIDREAMAHSTMTGYTPAYRLSAPGEPAYKANPDYKAWDTTANIDLAKEELQKALDELGATADEIPVLELMCFESQGAIDNLAAVQDQLRVNLGLETEIAPKTIQVMISDAMSGNYDLWWGGNAASVPDACESYLDGYQSTSGAPLRGYADPEFDALFTAAVTSPTLEERLSNYGKLEEYFCDNAMSLILGWDATYTVTAPGLTGYYLIDGGYLIVAQVEAE
ncbi:MAG: peptide ABC transporter substrate-binding protein [Clostridia bacterium]|nr:peptide ABC transporter substrate-binding protein [Clostridia bacterium]